MANPADAGPSSVTSTQITGWLLLVLVTSQLVYIFSGFVFAGFMSVALVLALPVIAFSALKGREAYLVSVCLALLFLTWWTGGNTLQIATEGLTRSAYLASFILLMALLREGALKSPAVLEVGIYLTRQPSSRRFLTLFGGAHFFSLLINLGSLSLLSPIIQRGVRAGQPDGAPLDEIALVRERRQLSAALRGFSWILVWAPTAVTQAVMPPLMPDIDAGRLMVTGLCLVVLMLVVSWAEDTLRWRGFARRLSAEGRMPLPVASTLPKSAATNLACVCVCLFGLSLTLAALGHVSIVSGVMLTAPIITIGWVWVQQQVTSPRERLQVTGKRLGEIAFTTMPGYIREAVFIACAGFIGTLAAQLIPADQVAAAIGLSGIPGWLVMWALTVLVWFFGQVGLSPITMAVFLASVVAQLPGMPVDMTHAALAIAAGTAVCSTGAPFASGALMLARATGHSSFTLTWRWNGVYTLTVLAVLPVIYALLLAL